MLTEVDNGVSLDESISHIDAEMTDVDGDDDTDIDGPDDKHVKFEDSDDEDDFNDWESEVSEAEADVPPPKPAPTQRYSLQVTSNSDGEGESKDASSLQIAESLTPAVEELVILSGDDNDKSKEEEKEDEVPEEERNVRRKMSHPSSPRSQSLPLLPSVDQFAPVADTSAQVKEKSSIGPHKVRVVIKDTPFTTFRALLYYVCIDSPP